MYVRQEEQGDGNFGWIIEAIVGAADIIQSSAFATAGYLKTKESQRKLRKTLQRQNLTEEEAKQEEIEIRRQLQQQRLNLAQKEAESMKKLAFLGVGVATIVIIVGALVYTRVTKK